LQNTAPEETSIAISSSNPVPWQRLLPGKAERRSSGALAEGYANSSVPFGPETRETVGLKRPCLVARNK